MKNLTRAISIAMVILLSLSPQFLAAQCAAGQTNNTYCYGQGEINTVAFEFCPTAGSIAQSTINAGSFGGPFPANIEGLTVYEGASGSGTSGTVVLGPVGGDLTGTLITASGPDLCLIFVINSNTFFVPTTCADGISIGLDVCSQSLAGSSVSFTAPADLCINAGVQTNLSGGSPTGGVYSGPGVTDNGNGMNYNFDPAAAGVGTHVITYTSGANNAMDNVQVVALPSVTFSTLADLCIDAGVQTGLGGGSPSGGVYSGPGVTDDGNGTTYSFNPAFAGLGLHIITYTPAGICMVMRQDVVEVLAACGCPAGQSSFFHCGGGPEINQVVFEVCPSAGMAAQATIISGTYTIPGNTLSVYEGASGSGTSGTLVTGPSTGNLAGTVVSGMGADQCLIFVSNSPSGIGCQQGLETALSVCGISIAPSLSFTAPDDLCIDLGVQTGLSGGLPTGGVYSGPGVMDDGNGMTYSFDPASASVGTHTITYTNGGTAMDDVEVFDLGTVGCISMIALDDLCIDAGVQNDQSGGSPTGGVYSGSGVMDDGNGMTYDFDPAAAGVGTHAITYTIAGVGSQSDNVEVFATPNVTFTAPSDVCITDALFGTNLAGSPTGGVYSGPGVEDLGNGFTYTFDPAEAGVGVHTLVYSFTDANGCSESASDDIEVFSDEPAAFTALADLCVNEGVQMNLGGGTPTGGSYSGPGVTDDGNGMTYDFDPAAAGIGTHTITYSVTTTNGCANSASPSDDVEVFALPANPDFTFSPSVCIDAGVSTLGPICVPCDGAVYSGIGVTDNGNGTDFSFDPSVTGVGVHPVTATLTNSNGCIREIITNITVIALPTVNFTAPADLCIDAGVQVGFGDGMPQDTINGSTGVYSGSGVTDNGNSFSYSFDPAAAGVGVHTLTYTFTDGNGCANSASDDIEVFALPIVSFTAPEDLCIETELQILEGGAPAQGTVTGDMGVYSGPGVLDLGAGLYVFIAEDAGEGTHTLTYTYTDANGCSVSASDDIFVDPICCEFIATCPTTTDLGSYNCTQIGNIPAAPTTATAVAAAPYNVTLGPEPCGTITVLSEDDITMYDVCAMGGQTITRTVTIFDDLDGNGALDMGEESQECTYTFEILEDTAPPVAPNPPGPVTVQCATEIPAPVTLMAMDECSGEITVSPTAMIDEGACANQFTMTRTWTFVDACGNSSSVSQIITVFDDTPPVAPNPPGPVTVQCATDIPAPTALTATDVCSGDITVPPTAVIDAGACANQFTMTRTWTFADACGNSSSVSQIIIVNDDTPPVLSAMPASTTVECDAIPAVPNITATDNCVDVSPVLFINELHYDNAGTDVGEFVEIAGTAGLDLSNYEVYAYEAFDGNFDAQVGLSGVIPDEGAGFGALAFTRTELPTGFFENGSADAIALVEIATGEVIDFISYEGTATANNGPAAGMTSTDIGVQEGGGTMPGESLQLVTLDNDPAGCVGTDFIWTGPTAASPGSINSGQSFSLDACPQDNSVEVIFSEVSTPGDCPQEQIIMRTWTATDACGNPVTYTQTITVEDNTAPEFWNAPENIVVDCEVPAAEILTATDNCDFSGMSNIVWVNEFHYDNTGADAGEFIEIAGVAGTALEDYQLVTYNGANGLADDVYDLSGTIDNESCDRGALSFLTPGLMNGSPDGFAFVDPDGVVIEFLSYEGSFTANNGVAMGMMSTNVGVSEPGGTPVGFSLQLTGAGASGSAFTWTAPAAASPGSLNEGQEVLGNLVASLSEISNVTPCDGGTVVRTWNVEDACGNMTVAHQQTILVNTPAAPEITSCPASVTVTCEEDVIPTPDDVVATIACMFDSEVTVSDPVIVGEPGCDGTTYTFTYTVTDGCDRTDECMQTFTLDNSAPVVTIPADATVTCAADIEVSTADMTVVQDCPGELILSVNGPVIEGPENCPGSTYTFTYRAIDDCGRIVNENRVFTIGENDEPTIIAPIDLTCTCLAGINPNPDYATITTSCDNGVEAEVTVSGPQIIGALDCPGTRYIYTYTVTDACGRTASDTQTYTVENDGPELTCPENCEILSCFDGDYVHVIEAWIETVEATSSCGTDLTVSNNFNGNPGLCINNGFTPVTFSATDDCGRTSSCQGMIIITDTDAPEIYEDPQDVLVPCNGNTQQIFNEWLATRGGAEAVDGCWTDNINWSASVGPNALNCANGPQAIVVTFTATDGCGNSASTTGIFNTKIQPNMVNVNGLIMREDNEPVANVEVGAYLGSGIPQMDLSDSAGDYAFPELEYDEDTEIKPEKNDDPLNGVSTFDLVLLQQHILGINTLNSPYKQIAADINRSGNISTLDLVLLRKLILHIDEEFTDNTSWRFVDADYVFPNPQNPFESEFPEVYNATGQEEEVADFIAVKIGDLNLDGATYGFMDNEADDRDLETLNFSIEDQELIAGEEYRIEVTAQNFERITGFQFTLNFENEMIEVMNIEAGDLVNFNEQNYNLAKRAQGAVPMSWNVDGAENLDAKAVAFSVIINPIQDVRLSEVLSITSQYTKAEAYKSNDLMNVNLSFNDNGQMPSVSEFKLFQNTPNPFKDATTIGFRLPEAGEVSLEVYDVSGRLLFSETGTFARGYNQFEFDRSDLPDGIFYYQVTTVNDADSKKMIIVD